MSESSTTSSSGLADSYIAKKSFDASQCTICEKCEIRYVEPHETYRNLPKKGQRHLRCRWCMSTKAVADKEPFPEHLMVPMNLLSSTGRRRAVIHQHQQTKGAPKATKDFVGPAKAQKSTSKDVKDDAQSAVSWLASLTAEQESILMHPPKLFSPATALKDLAHAPTSISWAELSERMRDVHSLDRLFADFAKLRVKYKVNVNTVTPICLLATSLNNVAIYSDIPFKFCWLDCAFEEGEAVIFMALNVWTSEERMSWSIAPPAQRVKACSAWETSIRESANTVSLPYKTVAQCRLNRDGMITVQHKDANSLLWVRSIVTDDSAIADSTRAGELLFSERKATLNPDKLQSSNDLINLLVSSFHRQLGKKKWGDLQKFALNILRQNRAPTPYKRSKIARLILDKREGQAVEIDEDSG